MLNVSIFVLINGVMGAVLSTSGAITAYADTLGSSRWVSVVLGGIGVAQILTANILHLLDPSTNPVPPSTTVNGKTTQA